MAEDREDRSAAAVTNLLMMVAKANEEWLAEIDRLEKLDVLRVQYADTLVNIIRRVGHELYCSTLIGADVPSVTRCGERMCHPQPGDVVLETSSFYVVNLGKKVKGKDYWAKPEETVGILDRETREPIAGEWEETEEDPRPTERVWYIKRLRDGGTVRWTNANFVAIFWPGMGEHYS
jgi:hypothetical protein